MSTLFNKLGHKIVATATRLKTWGFKLVMLPVDVLMTLLKGPWIVKKYFSRSEESEFKSESIEVSLQDSSYVTVFISVTCFALVATALTWAAYAELDEITRGSGTVIPASRLQVVGNLEGGIIKEIYVEDGESVRAGQPLLQLDDIQFSARFRENELAYFSEFAKVVRLKAEVNDESLEFPEELNNYPEYIQRERDFYDSRKKTLKQSLMIAGQEVSKMYQELESARVKSSYLEKNHALMKQEYDLTKPMADEGVVSKVQVLRLKKQVGEIESQLAETRHSITQLEAAWKQAKGKQDELTMQFREQAIDDLKTAELKLSQLTVNRNSLKDKVSRTIVRSPVDGIVKKIYVNTISGVVEPGMGLVDIIPVNEALLVEVKVAAKDIAFLREGMKAMVKFTAYDFTRYGGLEGKVVHISPDALQEKDGKSYYMVQVKTEKSYFGAKEQQMRIIPGMQTSVDILTGKKTVLEYLMKPILRAKKVALTER